MDKNSLNDSLNAWEANAQFWDDYMGEESNAYHRELVRPGVDKLLDVAQDDFILDIACGNGNYSAYLAQKGARVVAVDYSPKMIELAKKRRGKYLDRIEFCVADATNAEELMLLKRRQSYDKAVSNMAIMDIEDIEPLFECVHELLGENGIFVFATQHPCFVTLTDKYMTAHSYKGEAIAGQPQLQLYYHRSFQQIFGICFKYGFIIDGFVEQGFSEKEKPEIIIVRAKKTKSFHLKE